MTKTTIPYSCVRCNLKTAKKGDMKRHLYKKTICPATLYDVTLTEEIKQYILMNRTYNVKRNGKYILRPMMETATVEHCPYRQEVIISDFYKKSVVYIGWINTIQFVGIKYGYSNDIEERIKS